MGVRGCVRGLRHIRNQHKRAGRIPAYQIAATLTAEGVPTPGGKRKWGDGCVRSILTNEKYKGDALLQKVFTTDYLTKRKKKNEGEVPQYYVTDNHPAIIDTETFDLVQARIAARSTGKVKVSSTSVFCSTIRCGDCGGWFGRRVQHSNDKYRRVVWQCRQKSRGRKCSTPSLSEDEIKAMFLSAANTVLSAHKELFSVYESYLSGRLDTGELEREAAEMETEIEIIDGLIRKNNRENARKPLDQEAFAERSAVLNDRRAQAIARRKELEEDIARSNVRREGIARYLERLKEHGPLTEFRKEDWRTLVDHMTVHGKDDVQITFIDGSTIKAEI